MYKPAALIRQQVCLDVCLNYRLCFFQNFPFCDSQLNKWPSSVERKEGMGLMCWLPALVPKILMRKEKIRVTLTSIYNSSIQWRKARLCQGQLEFFMSLLEEDDSLKGGVARKGQICELKGCWSNCSAVAMASKATNRNCVCDNRKGLRHSQGKFLSVLPLHEMKQVCHPVLLKVGPRSCWPVPMQSSIYLLQPAKYL